MPRGILGDLLAATAPQADNPNYGLHETTPDMLYQAYQSTNPNSGYDNLESAQDAGVVPQQSIYHDFSGKVVTDPSTIAAYSKGSLDTTNAAKTPGFWQRFVNPQAAAAENAINRQPLLAAQAHNTSQNLAAGDASTFRPAMGTDISKWTPQQIAIGTGNNPSAAGMLNADNASTDYGVGLPSAEAYRRLADANTGTVIGNNRFTTAFDAQRLDVPTKEAVNESTGLDLGTARNDTGLLAESAVRRNTLTYANRNEPQALDNSYNLSLGTRDAIPNINRKTIADSALGADMSEFNYNLNPYMKEELKNNAIGGAYGSRNRPASGAYLVDRINPDGTVTPNTKAEDYASPLAKLGGLTSVPSAPTTVTTKDGRTVVIPPANQRPIPAIQGTRPIGVSPIQTPPTPQTASTAPKPPADLMDVPDQPKPADQMPIQGFDGFTVDGDGTIYRQGEKWKGITGSPVEAAAKQQLMQAEQQAYYMTKMRAAQATRPAMQSLSFPSGY